MLPLSSAIGSRRPRAERKIPSRELLVGIFRLDAKSFPIFIVDLTVYKRAMEERRSARNFAVDKYFKGTELKQTPNIPKYRQRLRKFNKRNWFGINRACRECSHPPALLVALWNLINNKGKISQSSGWISDKRSGKGDFITLRNFRLLKLLLFRKIRVLRNSKKR